MIKFPHNSDKTMTSKTPREIADAYLDAIEAREFERARTYLADHNFEYHSPILNSNNPDEFIANVSHVGPILERIDRRRTFADGDEVCQILTFITNWSSLTPTDAVQWTKVKDGKIVFIESFFDGRAYREMFVPEGE